MIIQWKWIGLYELTKSMIWKCNDNVICIIKVKKIEQIQNGFLLEVFNIRYIGAI